MIEERKVARLKRKLSSLEAKENLSCCGWESVGRLKEAIDIYEEMIDLWETEDDTNEKNVTFDNTNDLLVQFAMLWGMEMTNYINEDECKQLQNELTNITFKK